MPQRRRKVTPAGTYRVSEAADCLSCVVGPFDSMSTLGCDPKWFGAIKPEALQSAGGVACREPQTAMRKGKKTFFSVEDLNKLRVYSCRTALDDGSDKFTKKDKNPPRWTDKKFPVPEPFVENGVPVTFDSRTGEDGLLAVPNLSGKAADSQKPDDPDVKQFPVSDAGTGAYQFESPQDGETTRVPNNSDGWYQIGDSVGPNEKIEVIFEKFNLENEVGGVCGDWIMIHHDQQFLCARHMPNNGILHGECGKKFIFRLKTDHEIRSHGFKGNAKKVSCDAPIDLSKSALDDARLHEAASFSIWAIFALFVV